MTMRIGYFCFITGASAALIGMSLGIAMGISHDFTLAPVHAHLNLLAASPRRSTASTIVAPGFRSVGWMGAGNRRGARLSCDDRDWRCCFPAPPGPLSPSC